MSKSRIILVCALVAIILVGFWCVPKIESIEKHSQELEPLSEENSVTLKEVITSNASLVRTANPGIWKIPSGINLLQMTHGASITNGGMIFGFAEQPNMWNPLWLGSGNEIAIQFAGVLVSKDEGKSWQKLFSIPQFANDESKRFNPIGIFIEGGRLFVDIANDDGAGSGEGTIVRYSTTDGMTWSKADCFYLSPEQYYDLSQLPETYTHYGLASTRPHAVKRISCPQYILSK